MAHRVSCRTVASREENNKLQAATFNSKVEHFTVPLPQEVEERLEQIVGSVPELGPGSRVLDVGSGTGCLIHHMQARGVQDVLAVDLSSGMLDELRQRFSSGSTCGNNAGVRTWCGDVQSLPAYQGPFDAAFFNAVFGNVYDQRDTLLHAALLLKPGGHIVLSHPLGRQWLAGLHRDAPRLVPHDLPDQAALQQLVADLPLEVRSVRDEPDLYIAVLQVPKCYAFAQSPLYLEGAVVTGFGRGSKQMGVPTANLPPEPLAAKLEQLPLGVYFGWAQLDTAPEQPPADREVHKMVMNVGRRPTIGKETDLTVEVHVLHKFSQDFYGRHLRVVTLGYIRPEMKFDGLPSLIARIKADIGIAKSQLDLPELVTFQRDRIFTAADPQQG
ncbi:hypothetical protein WJX72_000132 [[Myrmecia] bisecta]|uniref:riboflavin kinase n=1 Tax=[Myrmecia] bisecta TaxID=41462 RepID=A0AAW1PRW7_9CHLO